MGDIADMMLSGDMCQGCGILISGRQYVRRVMRQRWDRQTTAFYKHAATWGLYYWAAGMNT